MSWVGSQSTLLLPGEVPRPDAATRMGSAIRTSAAASSGDETPPSGRLHTSLDEDLRHRRRCQPRNWNPDQGFLAWPAWGIAFSVRCLMADAYEDGHERGCAESRTQALEDMKPGRLATMSTDPSSSGRRRSCVSNDRGDGGDIRGAKMSTRRPQPGVTTAGRTPRPSRSAPYP